MVSYRIVPPTLHHATPCHHTLHVSHTPTSTLSSDAPVLLDESKCTVVREGVQCVCMATGNPEPVIEFYLPDKNITINDTDGRYNYYTHTDGHTSTGMIKLREKGERLGNGAVNVHCSISNIYGSESFHLELQQESEYTCSGSWLYTELHSIKMLIIV